MKTNLHMIIIASYATLAIMPINLHGMENLYKFDPDYEPQEIARFSFDEASEQYISQITQEMTLIVAPLITGAATRYFYNADMNLFKKAGAILGTTMTGAALTYFATKRYTTGRELNRIKQSNKLIDEHNKAVNVRYAIGLTNEELSALGKLPFNLIYNMDCRVQIYQGLHPKPSLYFIATQADINHLPIVSRVRYARYLGKQFNELIGITANIMPKPLPRSFFPQNASLSISMLQKNINHLLWLDVMLDKEEIAQWARLIKTKHKRGGSVTSATEHHEIAFPEYARDIMLHKACNDQKGAPTVHQSYQSNFEQKHTEIKECFVDDQIALHAIDYKKFNDRDPSVIQIAVCNKIQAYNKSISPYNAYLSKLALSNMTIDMQTFLAQHGDSQEIEMIPSLALSDSDICLLPPVAQNI